MELNMANSTLDREAFSEKTVEPNISKSVININLFVSIQSQNGHKDKFGHVGEV